jgi:ATP-binding cassette, subfamily G (WHITE), member 2, SNQ2
MCGLEDLADAVVGSLGVESRKRTTIAVELAAKPKLLLFLDEPTSGLDSQSAWSIMSFLRSLADNGQAILCTYVQCFPIRLKS